MGLQDADISETHQMIENRQVHFELPGRWILIRKPYKRPNRKENWPKSFPRDYLWTLGKGLLY